METFKDFFACRIVLAADQRYAEIIQRFFQRQKSLSLKSSTTWKHSKTFSPAESSQPQIIDTPKKFEDFFTCRIVLAANHQQHGNLQRLFRLEICHSLRSSIPRKHSETFSPAELSWPQIIDTPKTFRDFFGCKIVLAADHRYPEFIQRLFHWQENLSLKSSTTWKRSMTFSPAELSQPQIIKTWKHSKTFSPADLSQPQIIDTPKTFKDFFACRIVLAADHRYPENIHSFFSPAELSQRQIIENMETFKDFFAGIFVLAADHRYSEKLHTLFRLQNCLSLRSSIPPKHSETFSPAELSWPQIIDTPKIFKDFFT